MSTEEPKAVVKLADSDLFVGLSPSGHSMTIETNGARTRRDIRDEHNGPPHVTRCKREDCGLLDQL